ncbi:MAG: stage II sporulation protein M [Allosphingosinicella sp.]|uniref:stage II sporulation protein M n=1 Tax=Allosphingosinicella sp. TaxID=2823234 RepID=UPI003944BA02
MTVAPASAATGSNRFREAREEEWRRLEAILATAERKSVRALSDEDLLALPVLYRGALSSLSVARETSLDLELITYLEGLCARAYFFVYGVRTSAWSRAATFFGRDWPDAVRSLWKETLIATLLLVVGAVAGALLVGADPVWYHAFVPAELANGRDFGAETAFLRDTLYGAEEENGLGVFAAFLFTHNSQVAIFCFALGFAFGVPTAMLLVYTGAMLGAMMTLFASRGLALEFGGWVAIHGTTELFAIILAGAAGLRIGWAIVFPGDLPRLAAATKAGRMAATAMAGVVLMLFVAGLLEGYGRQLITSDIVRYMIAGTMLLVWAGFYYLPRRRTA